VYQGGILIERSNLVPDPEKVRKVRPKKQTESQTENDNDDGGGAGDKKKVCVWCVHMACVSWFVCVCVGK